MSLDPHFSLLLLRGDEIYGGALCLFPISELIIAAAPLGQSKQ